MRRDHLRLGDILEALEWIMNAIRGKTESTFIADETLCYAVAQRLTTVGEAVARLTPELKVSCSSVPWQDIVGLRNMLIHEYFGIHWPLVWRTAAHDVPVLPSQIVAIRQSIA